MPTLTLFGKQKAKALNFANSRLMGRSMTGRDS